MKRFFHHLLSNYYFLLLTQQILSSENEIYFLSFEKTQEIFSESSFPEV